MSAISPPVPASPIEYPDSDGKPMSDNTKQARWITVLYGNLGALYRDRPDVFVAADLLWYAVEGQPGERTAPDTLVAFGRPKGDRGSYRQWEEAGVPVTVAFEVRSPNNTDEELADKQAFYEAHGVEEYYLYDPDANRLSIFLRKGTALRREHKVDGFVSPRLGIRFDLSSGPEMAVYYPTGRRFLTFEELEAEREGLAKTNEGLTKANEDLVNANESLEMERDLARQRAARLAELSRKARLQQATPEELAELEKLESEAAP